jgi:hypothetical protein
MSELEMHVAEDKVKRPRSDRIATRTIELTDDASHALGYIANFQGIGKHSSFLLTRSDLRIRSLSLQFRMNRQEKMRPVLVNQCSGLIICGTFGLGHSRLSLQMSPDALWTGTTREDPEGGRQDQDAKRQLLICFLVDTDSDKLVPPEARLESARGADAAGSRQGINKG